MQFTDTTVPFFIPGQTAVKLIRFEQDSILHNLFAHYSLGFLCIIGRLF